MEPATVVYFGKSTVERAIADYLAKHGVSQKTQNKLVVMATADEDNFFQMVCDFVEKNG